MQISNKSIIEHIHKSQSLSHLISLLNLRISGHSFKLMKHRVQELNLDTSHWNKYRPGLVKIPLDMILVQNSTYKNSTNLKNRLIRENLITNKCNLCQITNWQGEKLSLHLDHINGIRTDNRLGNLRLLCPNCHSLTETYCGKNNRYLPCKSCGKRKESTNAKYCELCQSKIRSEHLKIYSKQQPTKINWLPTDELISLVNKSSYLAVGRLLGVSDNAVRNRIKRHT